MQHLRSSADLLSSWCDSKRPGLTGETYIAWIQTLRALADLAAYLLKKHSFEYVLLGKMQSDPLEGRFGIYRQVNGASFFISVRQALLAEKKLRVLNLLQLKLLKAADSEVMEDNLLSVSVQKVEDSCWLAESLLTSEACDLMDNTDRNLVYFLAGYIGRFISRVRKCDSCKDTLLQIGDCDKEIEFVSDSYSEKNEYATLLEQINRGGLSHPSEYCFAVCCIVFSFYQQIVQNKELHSKLMNKPNQCSVFCDAVLSKCSEMSNFITKMSCTKKHLCFPLICTKMFNTFSRNTLKRFNDAALANGSTDRKIRKLTSKTSK